MEIRFYATLRPIVGGRSVALDDPPPTVGELLDRLCGDHDGLRDRVLDEHGQIRQFVAVIVDGRDVRHLEGLQSRLRPNSEIDIFPPVAGGR